MLSLYEGVTSYFNSGGRPVSPLSLAARIGGTIGGTYIGYKMDPTSRMGWSHGLVNGSNLGDFVGDLIDKRPAEYAARDLAYKSAVGNGITYTLASRDTPFSGAIGAMAADITTPMVFGPDPKEPIKNKKKG